MGQNKDKKPFVELSQQNVLGSVVLAIVMSFFIFSDEGLLSVIYYFFIGCALYLGIVVYIKLLFKLFQNKSNNDFNKIDETKRLYSDEVLIKK
jgi:Ca2+/Na+ antiporter